MSSFLKLPARGAGRGSKTSIGYPWRITVGQEPAPQGQESSYFVKVGMGSISGTVPTNIFEKFPIDKEGTWWVKVKCNTNGKSATSSMIIVDHTSEVNNAVTKGAAPTEFSVVIGAVVKRKPINLIASSIYYNPRVVFIEDNGNPNEPESSRWWSWSG